MLLSVLSPAVLTAQQATDGRDGAPIETERSAGTMERSGMDSIEEHAAERETFHAYARDRLAELARIHDGVARLLTGSLGAEAEDGEPYAARLRELGRQRAELEALLEDLETRSGDSWKQERQRMMELFAVLETQYSSIEEALAGERTPPAP